jgi:hypothetical protein
LGTSPKSNKKERFMKAKIIGLMMVAAFALAFAFAAGAPGAPNSKAVPAAAAPAPAPAPAANAGERHPEIREAVESLRRAKAHMEHAANDFGGHRVEAIRATDNAIHQLEECLRFDKD